MDMHDIRKPDATYDLVYASYVVAYSEDIQRACSEFVRVSKPGGLVAIAFVSGCSPES